MIPHLRQVIHETEVYLELIKNCLDKGSVSLHDAEFIADAFKHIVKLLEFSFRVVNSNIHDLQIRIADERKKTYFRSIHDNDPKEEDTL